MIAPASTSSRRRCGRALLAALLAAPLACAINPVSRRPELVLVSTRREVAVGEELARELAREMGVDEESERARYVAALGERLAAHSPRRDVVYRFALVDMPEPNAFALPGGRVYISSGLLGLANSEDELAGVLGHEIVHVAARHAVQQHARALPVGVLSAVLSLPAALLGVDPLAEAVGWVGQTAGALLLAKYGRDQEREADRVGQELAARAGYDPAALAGLLATLERRAELAADPGRRPSFFDTHPTTPERRASALERARRLERAPDRPLSATRAQFLARLDGLRVGPDPGEGVFRDALFLHPDLDFAVRFPQDWKTFNSRRAVGAVAPDGDALLVVELQGPGEDPAEAARALVKETGIALTDLEPVQVAGWPAVRALSGARTRRGALVVDLTFLARDGLVYRITGACPVARYGEPYGPLFRDGVRSYRPLRPDERAGFTALRLRLARARPGETLAELSRRTDNRWSPEETAAANALPLDVRLRADQAVKVALEEPYTPRAPAR